MNTRSILDRLPYAEPFLFVDRLVSIDEERIVGEYTFREDSWFYEGHFKDKPVTPGVLLTECCAQIGLACLGLYLLEQQSESKALSRGIALAEDHMEFLLPVLPGQTVQVRASKEYFRFGKLKVQVSMHGADNALICKGWLSGMIIPSGG